MTSLPARSTYLKWMKCQARMSAFLPSPPHNLQWELYIDKKYLRLFCSTLFFSMSLRLPHPCPPNSLPCYLRVWCCMVGQVLHLLKSHLKALWESRNWGARLEGTFWPSKVVEWSRMDNKHRTHFPGCFFKESIKRVLHPHLKPFAQ